MGLRSQGQAGRKSGEVKVQADVKKSAAVCKSVCLSVMRIGKRVHFNRGWLAGWPAGWQLQVGRGEHGHTYIHLGQEEGGEEEVAVVVVEEEMEEEEDFLGAKVMGCNIRKIIVTGKKLERGS